MIGILLLVFLISSYIAYLETKNEILNLEESISIAEKNLAEKDKEIEPRLEEFNGLNCDDKFIRSILSPFYKYKELFEKYYKEYGEEKFKSCNSLGYDLAKDFETHNFLLTNILKNKEELIKKKQTPLGLLVILISSIIVSPLILELLVWLVYGLKAFSKFSKALFLRIKGHIAAMTAFQKYLIGLLLGILIVLILVLLKLF